jgi:glycosyltransferase involved in cell wall biosynthesis
LPAASFVIQWTGDYRLTDGTLIEKDNILSGVQNISYIPTFKTSQEYYQWIGKTDIMLLPYRKGFYRDKLSRVAIDAALAGIPMIYPVGTWLEDFVEAHAAGVGFDEGDPESLAVAIEDSMSRYGDLRDLALSRKDKTAVNFSAQSFFDEIARMIS